MAIVLEEPEGVGGVPVVLVAVEDDGRVVGDAALGKQVLEGGLVDEVALDLVLELGLPVELDRAGNVADLVEQDVLIGFDDPDPSDVEIARRATRW